MPLYEFENTETGEYFTDIMKNSDKEEFLEQNPHIKQIHTSGPAVGDPVRMGIRRPDNGFKEVMSKIHEKTPGSTLNKVADF